MSASCPRCFGRGRVAGASCPVCGPEASRRRSVRYFHLRCLSESRRSFDDAAEHARGAFDAGASLADLRRFSGFSTAQVKALLATQPQLWSMVGGTRS